MNNNIKLFNAITEALREMEKCPNDSVQDIWNECLKSWETGLKMNHLLELEVEINNHENQHPKTL